MCCFIQYIVLYASFCAPYIAFGGMAATIIFGLTFATLLTLFVTPALYAMFYKIKSNSKYASYEKN